MSVIERWTIYEGIEGTPGIWIERGDHPGFKGKLRGKFRRVVVVPEDQLTGAVDTLRDLVKALENVSNPGDAGEPLDRAEAFLRRHDGGSRP